MKYVKKIKKKHTKDIGDISEAMVLAALIKSGRTVLQPFGENHRYDFVIETKEGNFQKIQNRSLIQR